MFIIKFTRIWKLKRTIEDDDDLLLLDVGYIYVLQQNKMFIIIELMKHYTTIDTSIIHEIIKESITFLIEIILSLSYN